MSMVSSDIAPVPSARSVRQRRSLAFPSPDTFALSIICETIRVISDQASSTSRISCMGLPLVPLEGWLPFFRERPHALGAVGGRLQDDGQIGFVAEGLVEWHFHTSADSLF